jgi:uncharacterized protein with FMN-binding domain
LAAVAPAVSTASPSAPSAASTPLGNPAVASVVAPASTPQNPDAHPATPESPSATPAATPTATPVHYRDGTYAGWGHCRHGDIEATVVIEGGRIASATISQCQTRYSCAWIAPLPPQVVSDQSSQTDIVTGASESSDAFYYAVVEALGKAK